MKKRNFWKKAAAFVLAIAAACTVIPAVTGAQAEAASTTRQARNFHFYYGEDMDRSFYADITGDGKDDKIRVKIACDKYEMPKNIKIYVNGKRALYDATRAVSYSVSWFQMKKGASYLQVVAGEENGLVRKDIIYRYKSSSKKLVKAANVGKDLGEWARNQRIVKVTSKYVRVATDIQPCESGFMTITTDYYKKGSRLVRKSSYCKVQSTIFSNNTFKAKKKLRFVTRVGGKKTAFTVKKKDKVKLNKAWLKNGKLWVRYRKGKKNGWIKELHDYDKIYHYKNGKVTGGWFYGVHDKLAG